MSSVGDLLAATDCADLETLSDVVDADCEPDMWVAEIDGGVEIGSGTRATGLEFPFPIAKFWLLVGEIELEQIARIERTGDGSDDGVIVPGEGTMDGDDRISVWSQNAREKLIETAQSYHAVITYGELARHMQAASGLHTDQHPRR